MFFMQIRFSFFPQLLTFTVYICSIYGKWLNIRIPNGISKRGGYICSYKRLPRGTNYVVKFQPRVVEGTLMQMFGCSRPRHYRKYWRCNDDTPCDDEDEERLIYTWVRNSQTIDILPEDVGFKVGRHTKSKYLVIKVYYTVERYMGASLYHRSKKKQDGIGVYITSSPRKYIAGIYMFSAVEIKVSRKEGKHHSHIDIGCRYQGSKIVPFAFWCQTNVDKSIASAYMLKEDGEWNLIGKCSLQESQLFYSIPEKEMLLVKPGNSLVTRCTYERYINRTQVPERDRQMCEFYMMYYMLNKPLISTEYEQGCDSVIHNLINFPREANIIDTPEVTLMPTSLKPHHSKSLSTSTAPQMILNKSKVSQVISNTSNSAYGIASIPKVISKAPNSKINATISSVVPADPKAILIPQQIVDIQGSSIFSGISGLDLHNDGTLAAVRQCGRTVDTDSFDDEYYYTGSQTPIEENTLLNINPIDGKVLNYFGQSIFYLPHGFFVDHEDNYWVTDIGLHQVIKISTSNKEKPALTLGKALVPGKDDDHFCQPTDVAVDRYGNIFVADGYCNSRILKFDPSGKLIAKWEGFKNLNNNQGASNPHGYFILPHSLSIDYNHNHLYVSDLESGSISKFDTDGKFLQNLKNKDGGKLFAIDFNNAYGGTIYAISGLHKQSGVIIYAMSSNTGKLFAQWRLDVITHPRDIVVSPDNSGLYISSKSGLWKFNIENLHAIHQKETSNLGGSASYKPINIVDPNGNTDDVGVLPAIIVVTVLAIPVFLIVIAMIIQRISFRYKQNKVSALRAQKKNLRYPQNIWFGCCVTRKHYYDGNRGLDSFLHNHSPDGSDFDEENLFVGKA